MPNYNVLGIVINRRNLSENDKILTLFTREHGKISVVAKGARKPTSKFSGATELFVVFRAMLATGRTLDILTQCEIEQAFSGLRLDIERMTRATYFCELLDRFTYERDEATSAELFDLAYSALLLLQQPSTYEDAIVHAFELHLLAALGYTPVLNHCVKCHVEIDDRRQVGFSPSLGGTLCAEDRYRVQDSVILSPEALQTLHFLMEGETEELLTLAPSPKATAEVARALRWFVRAHTDREIKSLAFLDEMRAGGV